MQKLPPVFTNLTDPALIELIRSGARGVLLTDTVYGIVGSAKNGHAAQGVMDAKGRKYKPGTLIAGNMQQLLDLGVQQQHIQAAERFWPGPVSVVVPLGPELEYLHAGLNSLPVRIPAKPDLLALLQKVGPLLTTSANRPGEPMITSIQEAQEIFGNRLQFYVDGGRLGVPVASTIIKLEGDAIKVLRQGAVVIAG